MNTYSVYTMLWEQRKLVFEYVSPSDTIIKVEGVIKSIEEISPEFKTMGLIIDVGLPFYLRLDVESLLSVNFLEEPDELF